MKSFFVLVALDLMVTLLILNRLTTSLSRLHHPGLYPYFNRQVQELTGHD